MSLNLKKAQVEQLIDEVVALTGETKTEAVRRTLMERRARLSAVAEPMAARIHRYLEEEVWIHRPPANTPWSKEQEDGVLGYGPDGA